MIHALQKLEEMRNEGANFGLDAPIVSTPPPKDCFQVPIPCELLSKLVLFVICYQILKFILKALVSFT
jgi:hypothetical protein